MQNNERRLGLVANTISDGQQLIRVEPPPSDLISESDLANAWRFAELHGRDVRFTTAHGWLVWDGRRWASDEKGIAVQAMAKDTALQIARDLRAGNDMARRYSSGKRFQSKAAIEAMVWLARSESGIPAILTDFDVDPWLLNVANGTLDLRTGTLRPHDRNDLISRIADVAWDPNAEFDRWDEFIMEIVGKDEDLYCYVRRLTGYLLTGITTEQVVHFLYGLGANGKSVFCETILSLLGDYAIVCSPELIMQRRHQGIPNDVARLRGIRVAMMNETGQGSRFDEAKLKDLTGGDSLSGRFLQQEFFDFSPTHKLVIRGNHKPAIQGTDEGIRRRLRLVPFNVTIPESARDPDLAQKLKAELAGILRWAVDGCIEWQEKRLSPPAIISEAGHEYREESDTLGRFISEGCEIRPLAQVKSSTFFKRYRDFCEASGERWISVKDLPSEMQRRDYQWKRTNTGAFYYGIELRQQEWSNREEF
jgi:putative DNA primase/helicase